MDIAQAYNSITPELIETDDLIKDLLHNVCKDDAFVDQVFRFFFHSPGKKLRPGLAILSAFALKADHMRTSESLNNRKALIALAAISELVHTASLMHDDVLDESATRRGHPSLNAQFGNKIAILAGDILYSQAFELLTETADKSIIKTLTICVRGMCRGEINNLSEHSFETYKTIIEDKTAALMKFCCKAGAETVRTDDDSQDVVDALESFGYNFGMVYQLADDLDDHDSPVAEAHQDKTMALLNECSATAKKSLSMIPDSIYKASLTLLLNHLNTKSGKLSGISSEADTDIASIVSASGSN